MKVFSKLVLASALSAVALTSANAAFDDAGTDYTNLVTESYIDAGPAADALSMVDFLLCVMENSRATSNPNSTYSVLVDEVVCNGKTAKIPEYASQTMTTSGSSTPTAADPFLGNSWFVTADGMNVVAQTTISSGATTATPNGVFTMNWKALAPSDMVGSKGSLSFSADGSMFYMENNTQDGGDTNEFNYIHGIIANDGKSGQLRIKNQTYDGNGDRIYPLNRYVFDESHLHYDVDGSNPVCYDRASQTARVYGYQLFDSAGAKVAMDGPFGFKYTVSGTEYNGWASPHGAWLEGSHTLGANDKPTSITRRSDNVVYNICYDDDWESNSGSTYDNGYDDNVAGGTSACGTANDRITLGLTNQSTSQAYTFSTAKTFNSVSFDDLATTAVDSVTISSPRYDGAGDTLGIAWQCLLPADVPNRHLNSAWTDEVYSSGASNCANSTDWRPKNAMPNGTAITDSGTSAVFYVKSIDERIFLEKESDATPCADIPLANAPADAGYTAASIVDVPLLWSALPTVTEANKIKYIHGVAQ